MINLRYHVVSLTAVFLAIGIGIAFGASMVNRATVAVLDREVSEKQETIDQITADGAGTAAALQLERNRADQFESEGRSRLLTGHIVDQSVLAIAPDGISQETIDAFERVALDSESKYAGLIEFTDRLALGRPSDQANMATILDRDLDPEGMRRLLAERVSELLLEASQEPPEPNPDLTIPLVTTTIPPLRTTTTTPADGDTPSPSTTGLFSSLAATTTTSTTISQELQRREAARLADLSYQNRVAAAAEAASDFIEDLEREGFLTYRRSRARSLEQVLTPATEVRIVVLSDDGALEAPAMWIERLLRMLTADGVAPVVIAQEGVSASVADGETDDGDASDDAGVDGGFVEAAELPAYDLVGRMRRDEAVSGRLSTISHLGDFDGQVATVFALEDLPGRVGHYGPETGTDGLVPDDSP